jgi:diaminopimelate epimerase
MILVMRFTKMHGIGNDYVYVDGAAEHVSDPAELARRISDRHFGVGSDGLILILPSKVADIRMWMFNADGSEAEMCGNGVRCVAKYAYEHGLSKRNPLRVETGRGVLTLDLHLRDGAVEQVTVNMGHPITDLARIPVDTGAVQPTSWPQTYSLRADGGATNASFVSMGNPHAVIFVEDVAAVEVARLGPAIECHPAFPRRINVHWVQVISPGELRMRTWERGSGITLACGTGACAVVVAGVLTGRLDRKCLTHLPGGDLNIEWRQSDDNVYMTGPATEVFTGHWPSAPRRR